MLDFIIMTFSIAGGILLASIIMLLLVTSPIVVKWYSKLMTRYLNNLVNVTENNQNEDL